MALQNSGAISFSDLRGEYNSGSNTSVSMSGYYRGGTLIRSNASNNTSTNLSADVPTSGTISLDDFYGQERGFSATATSDATNKEASDFFGNDFSVNYPKKLTINSGVTFSNTTFNGVALNFDSTLSGDMTVTLNGTVQSQSGFCFRNQSSNSVTVNGSGAITRQSRDNFVSALQSNGSVRINYIGGFGGASGPDIYHSDYGGGFNSKLVRTGNTFTLEWTYNELDYGNRGSGSRDVSNMFPLDGNNNYNSSNTNTLTNTANVASGGRDTRNISVGRELRGSVMYYWFCSNNKSTNLELNSDRYRQPGHTQSNLTTGNSQRSSVIQSFTASTSSGTFSISGVTVT